MPDNNPNDQEVLILGIDAGTTSFKIAFCRAYERCDDQGRRHLVSGLSDKTYMLTGWPGYRTANVSSIPTPLIYDTEGRLFKWGHDAVNFQERKAFDPNLLVAHWKLGLHNSELQELLKDLANRFGKKIDSFVEDFFHAVHSYLFEDSSSSLKNHFGGDLSSFKYIDVSIAVPPGWMRDEHRIFSRAATKGLSQLPNLRLFTVSETECALRGWMSQEGRRLVQDGDAVLLVDLGGGTACISAFRYEEDTGKAGRWAHIESHSLSAGSELVTNAFICLFRSRLIDAGLPVSAQMVYKARQEFDRKKMGVGERDEEEEWDCSVDGLRHDHERRFQDGQMSFSRTEIRQCFEPLQTEIFDTMEEFITRLASTSLKPKYCVLAGAYARNILFKRRFDDLNNRIMRMQACWPEKLEELVATGACQARIEGDFRQLSGSRYSVGILTCIEWKKVPTKYRKYAFKFQFPGDRKWWARAIAWAIKKGDQVIPGEEIDFDGNEKRVRYPELVEQIQFEETIFTTESHPGDVKYTFLKFSTYDSASLQKNAEYLHEKYNLNLNAVDYTVDCTKLKKQDGSPATMNKSDLKLDAKKRRYFEYKYYFQTSQTDCRVSMEVFLAKGPCQKIQLQYSVQDIRTATAESMELQQEYDHLGSSTISTDAIRTHHEPTTNSGKPDTLEKLKRPRIASSRSRMQGAGHNIWDPEGSLIPKKPSEFSGFNPSRSPTPTGSTASRRADNGYAIDVLRGSAGKVPSPPSDLQRQTSVETSESLPSSGPPRKRNRDGVAIEASRNTPSEMPAEGINLIKWASESLMASNGDHARNSHIGPRAVVANPTKRRR